MIAASRGFNRSISFVCKSHSGNLKGMWATFFFLPEVSHEIYARMTTVLVCMCFCGCLSHQCESPWLSSPVGLREGVQPCMWMHLCPHPRVSTPTTLTVLVCVFQRIQWYESASASASYIASLLFVFVWCFSSCHTQGAQQDPGVQFLPDRLGGIPPSLCGWLILPLKHGWVLQQLSKGCQITQGPLTPRVKKSAIYIHRYI